MVGKKTTSVSCERGPNAEHGSEKKKNLGQQTVARARLKMGRPRDAQCHLMVMVEKIGRRRKSVFRFHKIPDVVST